MSDKESYIEGIPFPCGQCLPCRINRRRVWTLRLMLELYFHRHASFITLTYDDSCLPLTDTGVPIVCKRDFQLFMKRLRKKFHPQKIRFFACGEYGTKSGRPHYHAILYGIAPEQVDMYWQSYKGKSGPDRRSVLYDVWQMGLVHVGEVTRHSIQYVAGYVTKKLVSQSSEIAPPFCVMSRKPGIAGDAVSCIASALSERDGRSLRIDGKKWPMGRFLLQKLGEELGRDLSSFDSYIDEMRSKYFDYCRTVSAPDLDFISFLIHTDDQKVLKLEGRQKLFNQRSKV